MPENNSNGLLLHKFSGELICSPPLTIYSLPPDITICSSLFKTLTNANYALKRSGYHQYVSKVPDGHSHVLTTLQVSGAAAPEIIAPGTAAPGAAAPGAAPGPLETAVTVEQLKDEIKMYMSFAKPIDIAKPTTIQPNPLTLTSLLRCVHMIVAALEVNAVRKSDGCKLGGALQRWCGDHTLGLSATLEIIVMYGFENWKTYNNIFGKEKLCNNSFSLLQLLKHLICYAMGGIKSCTLIVPAHLAPVTQNINTK